ncbi:MAG: hypothetical protein UU24_C0006G0048 [Candidatus Nomurabacteria bacterium GW2011_GWA2_40_9]|uniref:Methyltransferase type 11 n=1 Tax=Candidatus Nomurabacteria bacterium GW2011_GWA2_40_9 TaxID=1618734 RepID=A0A0G0TRD0_9BACT|nr:MAG: hypothetical protein UU24_C0006G0048 [Candidatus Nomurabacteria bacterium GW2011_GWA2_40_9]
MINLKIYIKLIKRYNSPSLWLRFYIFVRLLVCPFDKILYFLPKMKTLIDVGCGSGLWLNFLALKQKNIDLLMGVDIDGRKLKLARSSKNKKIKYLDLKEYGNQKISTDCITLIDVVYLLSKDEQKKLFQDCFQRLNDGGGLFIKDVLTEPYWKFLFNYMQEFISVRVLHITYGQKFFWLTENYLINILSHIGFKEIRIERIDRWYPYPHFLCIAKK